MSRLLFILVVLLASPLAHAISNKHLFVEAEVAITPTPGVTFTWDAQATGGTVEIYRRDLGKVGTGPENGFNLLNTVAHPVRTNTDTTATIGKAYEYRIARPAFTSGSNSYILTAAYVAVTVEAPLVDSRGTVLLVADTTSATALPGELARLEMDLVGDGWKVARLDFAPHGVGTHQALRTAIINARAADSTINALYLFGRLPVARSGLFRPDGHAPDRAHETDLYYADVNGTWTDSTLNVPADASFNPTEDRNVPGDGKFDQTNLPSAVELMTGRVDFSKMTAYQKNEYELLRDYFSKSHAWRHGAREVPRRGLIGSEGFLMMEHNWLRPMFGSAATTAGAFQPTLATQPHVWAVDFGNADGTSADHYTATDNRAVFFLNFGSYKQQWNRNNNPMRGLLAQPDWGLTAAWGSRPAWHMHHMAAGETVGYSALRTINNHFNGLEYDPRGEYTGMDRYVSLNLMGDPTLRQHPVLPVQSLGATSSGSTAQLAWSAPVDATRVGFHVYRSTTRLGPYTRLTASPLAVTATGYTDSARPAGEVYYQVRAVARTTAATGTYLNSSQGVFAVLRADGSANSSPVATTPAPVLAATGVPAPITFPGTDADADTLTPIILENPAHGILRWNGATCVYVSDFGYTGPDSFTYRLSDGVNLSSPVTASVEVAAARDSVLLAWEFGSPASGSLQNPASTHHSALVQPASLTVGSGVTRSTNATFNDDGFHVTGVNSAAFDANDWIGWSVAPVSGSHLHLNRVIFFAAAGDIAIDSLPATADLQLRVSTDGFATHTVVPIRELAGTAAPAIHVRTGRLYTADLSALAALQNTAATVQFRLHVWNTANFALGRSQDTAAHVSADLVVLGSASYPPPIAHAGADLVVTDGPYDLQLDGTASAAPAATFAWTQTAGPSVVLSGADTATPSFPADLAGTYVFQLTVTNPGGTHTDSVTVTITPGDEAPIVNAGPDQQVALNATVTLNATALDYDGDALTYRWTQLSGPPVILLGARSLQTSFTATATGAHVFQFAATANGVTSTDTVTVTTTSDLTLHYTFDEGAGTTINDSATTGHSHTVTGVAGLTWSAVGQNGAAYASSSNGFVVPNAAELAPDPRSAAYTVTAWVKLTSATAYRYLFDLTVGTNRQLQISTLEPASSLRIYNANGAGRLDTAGFASPLTDGNWHLLTLVNFIENGTWKTRLYYDDGTHFVEINTGAGGVVDGTFRIGSDSPGNSYSRFPGLIDDLRIYTRALSAAEVAALYAGNAPTPAGSPEIAVLRGDTTVAQSSTDTFAGATPPGEPAALTYRIANIGGAPLTLGNATLTATNNLASASITAQPASPLAPNTETALNLTVTPAAAGPWSATVSLTTNDADENPAVWTLSGAAESASPQPGYAAWSASFDWGSADSAPTADPNGDGVSNLLAYALNLPPLGPRASAAALPALTLKTTNPSGAWLDFTYRRNLAATDVVYTVLTSTDLVAWSPVVAVPETVDPDADGDGRTVVERVRIQLSSGTPRRFLRLEVSR